MEHNIAWWRGSVIYQVYPRSFYDADGDGIGDLWGIICKLDYIASLGVDAIWLCPFYTSPQCDFGYDVADYVSVDPAYGSLDDFDVLVARAHALNLKVIIDQVWSHTSNQHPWFLQSRVSQTNAKADWFVWADPLPDGMPPNNWLAIFGGSAWTWEPRRRQYYLHHFLAEQPSLNYRNPDVIAAILQTGRFWLDRGVDGFRLDAIDFLLHDPLLRSNPASAPLPIVPAKLFALQEHVWDVLHPDRYLVYEAIRGLMDEYPGTTTIGEVSSQPGAFDRVISYTSGDRYLHMAYTLGHMRGAFDWPTIRKMLSDAGAAGDAGHVCWSFSNHDTMRAISRWKPERGNSDDFASMLFHLLLTMPGSVCIYQGEELGLTEANLTFDQLRDPFGIAYWPEFKGRDGSRTPIPWTKEEPECKPWLPIPAEHLPLAVEAQEADPTSLLHRWRRAIALRNKIPALRYGSMEVLDLMEPFIGFIRTHNEERILCIFNIEPDEHVLHCAWLQDQIEGFGFRLLTL